MKRLSFSSHRWARAFLVISISSNLLLFNICWTYFDLLESPQTLRGMIDSRGGLWEINSLVPCLMVVATASGLAAAQSSDFKRLALCSAGAAIPFGLTCFILFHLLRNL